MAASKKEIELWRLGRFKSFIADFPDGHVESTEEPDFLVHAENQIIGIELTDLHRGTPAGQIPQQASEAMRHRVVKRAQEIYESWNLPPVIVSLFLSDQLHVKKSEVGQLALELASLVASNVPEENASSEVPSDWNDFRKLPNILHKLSVRRLDVVTKTFFSAPGATWVPHLGREEIERVILIKEPKLPTYRARCSEVWLVINSDMESMSTWFNFESAPLQDPFVTNFNRVFVVQHFAGRVHELRLIPSSLRSE